MTKKSYGAILYAFDPDGILGIILGDESHNNSHEWLPFKGGSFENETPEQTAIRELHEETCGLITIDSINLHHKFSTKRKEYHIGLVEAPYTILSDFEEARKKEIREAYKEKKELRFFPFPDVLHDRTVHNISKSSILYYKNTLDRISEFGMACNIEPYSRYQGMYVNLKMENRMPKDESTSEPTEIVKTENNKPIKKKLTGIRTQSGRKFFTNYSYKYDRYASDHKRMWRNPANKSSAIEKTEG